MRKNKLYATFSFISLLCNAQETINTLFNQAVALHKQDPHKALELFEQVLKLEPNSINTHYNYAYVLKQLGKMSQAIAQYELVLKHQPQNSSAHIGLAQAYLALGNYEKGWQELEWRLGHFYDDVKILRSYILQKKSLQAKIILIRAEWGAGDAIQMTRYAKLLKAMGATVNIHLLHQSLVPLFKQQLYFDTVIGPNENPPPFHFQIPMMSLPVAFATILETIPDQVPYITIDQKLVDLWQQKLKSDSNFKIGICWRGNHIHDPQKFMPLHYFVQLAQIPGISLYSLQKIHGLDELEKLENKKAIKIFADDFDAIPFLDTTAVMKNLDLVITVDTSIAHLAGALAVPVWTVLPHVADWRWMLEKSDSLWYSTVRLFRQKKVGDWQEVIAEVIENLKKSLLVTC